MQRVEHAPVAGPTCLLHNRCPQCRYPPSIDIELEGGAIAPLPAAFAVNDCQARDGRRLGAQAQAAGGANEGPQPGSADVGFSTNVPQLVQPAHHFQSLLSRKASLHAAKLHRPYCCPCLPAAGHRLHQAGGCGGLLLRAGKRGMVVMQLPTSGTAGSFAHKCWTKSCRQAACTAVGSRSRVCESGADLCPILQFNFWCRRHPLALAAASATSGEPFASDP